MKEFAIITTMTGLGLVGLCIVALWATGNIL